MSLFGKRANGDLESSFPGQLLLRDPKSLEEIETYVREQHLGLPKVPGVVVDLWIPLAENAGEWPARILVARTRSGAWRCDRVEFLNHTHCRPSEWQWRYDLANEDAKKSGGKIPDCIPVAKKENGAIVPKAPAPLQRPVPAPCALEGAAGVVEVNAPRDTTPPNPPPTAGSETAPTPTPAAAAAAASTPPHAACVAPRQEWAGHLSRVVVAALCCMAIVSIAYMYRGIATHKETAATTAAAAPAATSTPTKQKFLSVSMVAATPAAPSQKSSSPGQVAQDAQTSEAEGPGSAANTARSYYAAPQPMGRDCERYRSPDNGDLAFSACCKRSSETWITCQGQFVNLGHKIGVLEVDNNGTVQDDLGNQQPLYRGNVQFGTDWQAWLYPPRNTLNPTNFSLKFRDQSEGDATSVLVVIPYDWGNSGFVPGIPGSFVGKFPIQG